jgi:hypothetical protein
MNLGIGALALFQGELGCQALAAQLTADELNSVFEFTLHLCMKHR